MVCLPNARLGEAEEGEDIYDAESARPSAIASADDRVMANARRARYEAIHKRRILRSRMALLKEGLC